MGDFFGKDWGFDKFKGFGCGCGGGCGGGCGWGGWDGCGCGFREKCKIKFFNIRGCVVEKEKGCGGWWDP